VAAAIELAGLTRAYGERIALRDVSLALEPGQTLVVFGPNGSGKTTLLRVLATLLRPTLGHARVLGHDLPGESWAVRGRLGFLGHEPLLYRELTGRENLRFQARLFGVSPTRVEELVDRLALGRVADDPVRTLSRGTVQRLAVARAVLHDPELLLADEPRANLDPAASELIAPLLHGRTRVITSHDPGGGLAEADVALGLRGGRVALLAPAGQVSERDVAGLYG
jgi:heme exporter protein A